MAEAGYTGISFPFRIGVKGGVVLSTANKEENTHIKEAIEQILSTKPNERSMEFHFKSDVISNIYDPADISTETMIVYQIEDALRKLEDRIEVKSVVISKEENFIYATINFIIKQYDSASSSTIRIGDVG